MDIRSINIGDKMQPRPVTIGCKRQRSHRRPKIRTANPDVHYIRKLSCAHLAGKISHPRQCGAHLGHHIDAIHLNHSVRPRTQRSMQNSTAFGCVDLFTRKHRVTCSGNVCRLSQVNQRCKALLSQRRFGKVIEHATRAAAHPVSAACIPLKQLVNLAACLA